LVFIWWQKRSAKQGFRNVRQRIGLRHGVFRVLWSRCDARPVVDLMILLEVLLYPDTI
jgi:hypothetical protein